ncbi:glycosyltransferase family 2 protein [Candidatus Azambacteria bacterium]|nr:glycosyltransferase family 2 protein [Candidatus Azambacteria bacterium]
MNNPLISINLVVYNEESRIRRALQSTLSQTYKNIEILVFDNASTDGTAKIVKNEFPNVKLFTADKNYSFGPGQNRAAKMTSGKYIVGMSADVVLAENFVKEMVKTMEKDEKIGALQAKILHITKAGEKTNIIDTTGFEIYRSRRVINRGHGEKDEGQYETAEEIFSYEGAVPVWRREAFFDCGVLGEAHDEDFWWMSDDIDFGWRINLFGWKNFYAPNVLAWHERQTTNKLSSSKLDFIKMRRGIRKDKKMLDILNYRLTLIKNDFGSSILKSILLFSKREVMLFIYFLFFEQYTLLAYPKMIVKIPKMLKKRSYIAKKRKKTKEEMEKWFK